MAVQVGPECGGTVVAQLVTQSAFESRADLAVATDGHEVHSCKRPGCAEVEYLPAGSFDPSVRVRRDGVDESVGDLDVRDGRAQPASHTGAGKDHDSDIDRQLCRVLLTPAQERLDGVADLKEDEVGILLPGWETAVVAGGHADVEGRDTGEGGLAGGTARFFDHRADGEFAGAVPDGGLVAVDEEEPVNAIRGSGQQVPSEAEQVAISRVHARDALAAHGLNLVRDGDARDGSPADVVVRDQE
ncbi:MAG TPA: hypothetical protein VE709_15180 [Pseudonocardiaceae bacterium]|nr:hypothetical protein [Pseudonocardiaceae bacterium]